MFSHGFAGLPAKPDLPHISGQMQIGAEAIISALSPLVEPEGIENTGFGLPYLQIIWLITAAAVFSAGLCKMHRFKKQILTKSSSAGVDRETLELFLQCGRQLNMRGGRVNLRTSGYIKSPLAFGLINPFVILPSTGMSAAEKRLALTHELTHIKNGDLWLKFAASVISAVHWFNPLVHLLRRRLSVISEEYCDECVVKEMGRDERLLYGELLLKAVCGISAPQFCSTLSAQTKNMKNIKRRLLNMMNLRKSRRSIVILSVVAAFMICSVAAAYAVTSNADAPVIVIENAADYDLSETAAEIDDISEEIKNNSENTVPDLTEDTSTSRIEWWTYEEYSAWLEEYRIELQAAVGTMFYGWTNGGVHEPFVLTQDDVDKEIEASELILEGIKNGTAGMAKNMDADTMEKVKALGGVVFGYGTK
jgi:beta-lactamase regulating signal transducer with metallopeptidase domain